MRVRFPSPAPFLTESFGIVKKSKKSGEKEVELKLKLKESELEKVFAGFVKKDKGTLRHKFYPRFYYDTEALDLHGKGISLRVQYKPGKGGSLGGYEQTVKLSLPKKQGQGDVMVRGEFKDMIAGQRPDISAIADKGVRGAIKPIKNKDLKHLFTAAVERRILMVSSKSPSTGKRGMVEVAFDIGNIFLPPPSTAHVAISEIELEVKSGPADVIEPLRAKILKAAPSAKAHTKAKSDQGVALYLRHKGGGYSHSK